MRIAGPRPPLSSPEYDENVVTKTPPSSKFPFQAFA